MVLLSSSLRGCTVRTVSLKFVFITVGNVDHRRLLLLAVDNTILFEYPVAVYFSDSVKSVDRKKLIVLLQRRVDDETKIPLNSTRCSILNLYNSIEMKFTRYNFAGTVRREISRKKKKQKIN